MADPPNEHRIKRKKRFNSRIPPSRVKKVLQKNEDIGRMASAFPVLLARSMEHFAEDLLAQANNITDQSGSKTLTPVHMKRAIMENRVFAPFLAPVAEEVTDNLPTQHRSTKSASTSSASSLSSNQTGPSDSKILGKRRKSGLSKKEVFADDEEDSWKDEFVPAPPSDTLNGSLDEQKFFNNGEKDRKQLKIEGLSQAEGGAYFFPRTSVIQVGLKSEELTSIPKEEQEVSGNQKLIPL